jgi:beta-glucosidase
VSVISKVAQVPLHAPELKEVTVTVTIPVKDLAYYNEQSRQWIVEPGRYILLAGTSSRDIKATEAISISGGK